MKRYTVKTYHNRMPLSRGRRIYNQIGETYRFRHRKGGVIVFPVDIMDFDNSFIEGKCSEGFYFTGEHKTADGAFFGQTSICVDVKDMSSGYLMTLAMKCSRLYNCTVLLKDCDDRRLFSIHYNKPENVRLKQAA